MGKSSKLATIEEIERLWFELQREMTESAKVSRFTSELIKLDGERVTQEVIRIGSYNLISEGGYVTYDIDNQLIKELPKQPESRFVDSTEALLAANSGFVPFGNLIQLEAVACASDSSADFRRARPPRVACQAT